MDSSLVLKARTVLHNAAAKAERVLTEIKADMKAERSRSLNTEAERVFTELKAERSRSLNTEANLNCEEFCIDGKLPWIGKCEHDKCHEGEYRKRILEISKRPNEFFANKLEGTITIDLRSEMPCLGAILEHDENLRNLRLEYVPKKMEEEEFWRHYFLAVKKVKQQMLEMSRAHIRFSIDEKCGVVQTRSSEAKNSKKDLGEEEAKKSTCVAASIPPLKSLKRLASAIEVGKNVRSLQELVVHARADKDFSQVSDWSSLVSGLATVRKLTSWEKDSKGHSMGPRHYQNILCSLFDADLKEEDSALKELIQPTRCKLIDEIHGAPPQSFVARLAEILAGMKTAQKMAEFWFEVLKELRRHWSEGMAIPCLPVDTDPDLSYCLLHQQLQVINCCIARRKRRISALKSLEMLEKAQASSASSSPESRIGTSVSQDEISRLYAKQKDGEPVMRLGVDRTAAELRMLETGEPIYPPITQEGPVLTEDLIKEKEELVLRTGSSGAGCLHLFSDMKAFKAANPGCILEDFVRWYSPLDWMEHNGSGLLDAKDSSSETSVRGCLSVRMQCEGNLWQELWISARPVPAVRQAPLFDEELAGESTLDALEAIDPSSFFEQLFITTLGIGFSVAETAPCAKVHPLARCLTDCRDYVVSTCGHGMSSEHLEHLCEVYDLMVAAVNSSPEETSLVKLFSLDKSVFKLNNIFQTSDDSEPIGLAEVGISTDTKTSSHNQESHHVKADSRINVMIRLLEAKASIFDRKSKSSSHVNQNSSSIEGDWTLI